MLTLSDVAKAMGTTVTLQQVRNRLRTLERRSGRRILLVNGSGKGTRYMVNAAELAAAMGDDVNEALDDAIKRVADIQNAQDDRITRLSQRVFKIERQLGLA